MIGYVDTKLDEYGMDGIIITQWELQRVVRPRTGVVHRSYTPPLTSDHTG